MKLLFAGCALLLLSRPIEGQSASAAALVIGGVDKLFDRLEAVNIYKGWRHGGPPPDSIRANGRAPWTTDYGLEFQIHLAKGGTGRAWQHLNPPTKKPPRLYDTTSITFAGGSTIPTAVVVKPVKPDSTPLWEVDLGVGYGQLNGIRAKHPVDLRANVRDLPSVSLYFNISVRRWFSVYAAGRTGVVSLQDAQVYFPRASGTDTAFTNRTGDHPVSVYSSAATTFSQGLAGGVSLDIREVSLTFEYGHTVRRFNTLNYTPGTPIPSTLPRELDLSAKVLYAGVQLPIKKQ